MLRRRVQPKVFVNVRGDVLDDGSEQISFYHGGKLYRLIASVNSKPVLEVRLKGEWCPVAQSGRATTLKGLLMERNAQPPVLVKPPQVGWRTVDTAPKDGTEFLAFVPSYYQGTGGIVVSCFVDGAFRDNRAWAIDISHWMPLPSKPVV